MSKYRIMVLPYRDMNQKARTKFAIDFSDTLNEGFVYVESIDMYEQKITIIIFKKDKP